MLKSSQITRSAVIAATVMTMGASPAHARPADTLARSKPAVTTVAPNGVRPTEVPAAPTAPAPVEPVTQPTGGSAALQWLLFPLGALLLAFVLILGGARVAWHAADTFRARHV